VAEERLPTEQFPALDRLGICRHAFIKRVPGIDVSHDKAEALNRLETIHRNVRRSLGLADWPLVTAEQIHGNKIAVIDASVKADWHATGADGFVTNQRGIVLGVHVADCAAVYIVDPNRAAIGLVHSGRKGTELGIVGRAIGEMTEQFGSQPSDLVVQLSPCIRPPHFEIDFAKLIVEQCRERGVTQVHDSGVCTACDLGSFYSYRAEKGKTGRMLALLGLR
jgi:copper oxidase (laccase) domain-containing protein